MKTQTIEPTIKASKKFKPTEYIAQVFRDVTALANILDAIIYIHMYLFTLVRFTSANIPADTFQYFNII